MLKIMSLWFSQNDVTKESRSEWGEYYATVKDLRGGEMRASMKVAGDDGGSVDVSVALEIVHSLDDEISQP